MERIEARRRNTIAAAIVKIASRCNLNCTYCYLYNHEDQSYRQQPKVMSIETFGAAVQRLREHCKASDQPGISIVLHGGEPTLVGARTLAQMCALAKEMLAGRLQCLAMQTNATLLSDEILSVVEEFDVALGISLDGDERTHDRQRVFRNGSGSYRETMTGIERLRRRGIKPRILCVVQPGQNGADVYRHFRSVGIDSIDFLLPDVSHDNYDRWYGDCGKYPVANYLVPAFDGWLEEDSPAVHVRLFDNLIKAVLGGEVVSDAFGNPLMTYLIVELNGDIEALDALKVCSAGITKTGLNVHKNSFAELEESNSLLRQAMFEGFDLCPTCTSCPESRICGGYLPHRFSRAAGFDNPSVWCKDILRLIAHVRTRVEAH